MKCKTCSYSLWNIRSRTCPECGTGFKPSDFAFIPQNVRFCCPHCSQAYYGTDANGLLEPREFDCVRCAEAITLDEMVLMPAEGVRDEDVEPVVNPWLAQPRSGWFKPLLSTAGRGMIAPRLLLKRKPVTGDTRRAWSFMLLLTVLGVFALAITFLVPMLAVALGAAFSTAGQAGAAASAGGALPTTRAGLVWIVLASVTGLSGGAFVLLGIALLIFTLVWTLIAHAVLMVTGPRSGSLGVTQQAILFTSGAMLPVLVPCVGVNLVPVLLIWWMISASMAIGVAQGVRWWRAFLAGVVAPLLTVVALVVSLVLAAVPLITLASAAIARQTNAALSLAQSSVPISTRLPELTRTLLDNPPAHGVELMGIRRTMPGAASLRIGTAATIGEGADPTMTRGDDQKAGKAGDGVSEGGVQIEIESGPAGPGNGTNGTNGRSYFSFARAAGDYFAPESTLKSRMITVAGRSLDDIVEGLSDGRPDALPTDATHPDLLAGADVAHRVGDLVFTYRGVNAVSMPSRDGLWLVICWPLHPIAAHLSPEPDAVSEPLSGDADRKMRCDVARARAIQAGVDPAALGTADEQGKIAVLRADGTTVMIPRGEFDEKLREQNEARARAGLAELPHPRSVTKGCVITPPIAPPVAPATAPTAAPTGAPTVPSQP